MSEDQKFVVTTTEIIVRQQEVWAESLAEAAWYVEGTGRHDDGIVVDHDLFLFRVEVAE